MEPLLGSDFSLPREERLTEDFDSLGTGTTVASLDTPLGEENKGYALMVKMGWKQVRNRTRTRWRRSECASAWAG